MSEKETKICKKCNEEKIVPDDYYEDMRSKDGFYAVCKACFAERRRQYRQKKKEREAEADKSGEISNQN